MLSEDYYLKKVRQSHKAKMDAARADRITPKQGNGLIVNRVEAACKELKIPFNKGSVANLIRKDLAKDGRNFDQRALTKAEKLFEALANKFA